MNEYLRDARRLSLSLAVMLLLVWAPFVFGGKTLLSSASDAPSVFPSGAGAADGSTRVTKSVDPGAPAWFSEPSLALEHRLVIDEHTAPMWDPFDGYGTPFAATMQAQPFNALAFLASIAPGPFTYDLYIIVRLFVLALGCALFVRLYAGFVPALVSGIAGGLSAYFIIYLDMPHVSVEILLPWLFIGIEYVVRRPGPRSAAALAAVWAWTIVCGMPESTALAATAAAAYALFRIHYARSTPGTRRRLGWAAAATGIGTCAAAILLVPFLELFATGFDLHQPRNVGGYPGLGADIFTTPTMLTEFAPLALGPAWNNVLRGFSGHSGLRGAPGTFAMFFASVAFVVAVLRYRERRLADRVALFLGTVALVAELKRYGVPLVQWIGSLPVLRLVNFPKYDEPIFAICVACAAGLGVAAIAERRASARVAIGTAAVVLAALTWLYQSIDVGTAAQQAGYLYNAVGFAVAVLVCATACAVAVATGRHVRPLLGALAAICLIEGACAYLVPIFYVVDKPPAASRDPYRGAPYVSFLQHATAVDDSRVLGTAGTLYPNWAGAFGLSDPRDLNAMYPGRYMRFIAALVEDASVSDGDWVDRFTGDRPIDFARPLTQRWLAISSIRYVMAPAEPPPPDAPNVFLSELWAQASPTITAAYAPAVRRVSVTVNGAAENGFLEHPPYDGVRYSTRVPARSPWVTADITLDPAVWNACGGAVTFRIDATGGDGRAIASVSRTIDPKHVLRERRWNRTLLDLSAAAGKPVTLRFATAASDACSAWAIWGEPRWTPGPDQAPYSAPPGLLHPVYRADSKIYRFDGAMARQVLFHNVQSVADGDEALKALTGSPFDVRTTVVLEGAAPAVSGSGKTDAVNLVRRSADRVELDVVADGDAVLMQNDTWYPGWRAAIDGSETPVLRADYLFRGIVVPSGRHRVVIEYRSGAVALGTALTALGLLAMALLGALPWLRDRSRLRRLRSTAS